MTLHSSFPLLDRGKTADGQPQHAAVLNDETARIYIVFTFMSDVSFLAAWTSLQATENEK